MACLAKYPNDRPASAAALRKRLLECTDASRWDTNTMVIDLQRRAAQDSG